MKNLAEKPFVLLGINSDADREELKKIVKKENITWRSWWDNGSTDGPIQTTWQIAERPAIYLLDANGVIRHKNVFEDDLEDAIEELLKEIAPREKP